MPDLAVEAALLNRDNKASLLQSLETKSARGLSDVQSLGGLSY